MNFGVYLRRDGRSLCGLSAGGCWSFGSDISIEWLESLPLIPIGSSLSTTFNTILKDSALWIRGIFKKGGEKDSSSAFRAAF
jgi:hypothetical protein